MVPTKNALWLLCSLDCGGGGEGRVSLLKAKMATKLGHGCHSVPSQDHSVFRFPKPDPAHHQIGALRPREVKQFL